MDRFWSFSLEDKGLDAYLVAVYPEEHKKYVGYQGNYQKFVKLYGTTREDIQGNTLPKGYLEIKFE